MRVQVSNFLQKYMFPDEILLEVIMEKTLVEMEFTFFFSVWVSFCLRYSLKANEAFFPPNVNVSAELNFYLNSHNTII